MIKAMDTLKIADFDFQILLRGVQRPMPEKLCDIRDINVVLQKVRCQGMPK